jgi:plastocyanin
MYVTTRAPRRLASLAIAGVLALSLAACGGDDDDDAASDTTAAAAATTDAPAAATTEAPAVETTEATADTTTPHTGAHGDHPTVSVDGVDYAYENLPAEIEAGTTLTFTNQSTAEFHEMVVIRIPDEETRSVEELAQLPEEESDAIFANSMPALVSVAPPGEEGMPVVGDGVISEPGRYAVVCFIPIGADPQAVMDAMQSESSTPPDLGDGPPHVTAGMYAELNVTA